MRKNSDSGLAEIVLNNPERCNALSGSMMCELNDALDNLKSWTDGKALLIYGAENKGNFFCSGGDLDTVRKMNSSEMGYKMSVLMNDITGKLANLPMLSVCLVEGPALGGGAELATIADMRLATSNAYVSFVQTKMGVSTGFGGGLALRNLVGYHKALDLIISGRRLGAEEGLRLGYFNDLLEADEAKTKAEAWTKQLVKHCTPLLIRNTKSILQLPDEQRSRESEFFSEVWYGEAHRKALSRNIKHK